MLKFILCVTFVAAAHAADFKPLYPHGPMFGGNTVSTTGLPFIVTVCENIDGAENQPLCTEILISQNHVLTTAGCVVDRDWPLIVRVKSDYRNAEVKTQYSVEKKVMHELHSVSERGIPVNDLALLKINLPANVVSSKALAQLYDDSKDLSAGVDVATTGWDLNKHLSARTVITLDTSLCDKAYESVGGVPARQICASYPGLYRRVGCQGDSGAPLLVSVYKVVGILSWGNGCVKPNYPGVYTSIAYYRDWIDETMRNL